MLKLTTGSLLETNAEALVNTVNTVGIMGKGIALQFKKAFPDNYDAYRKAAKEGKIKTGCMFIFERKSLTNPHFIINFPTKHHWKENSKLEYIKEGLSELVKEVNRLGVKSVAVPPLGCGLGGLNWYKVYSLMKEAFVRTPEVDWIVFEPAGKPQAKDMPNKTEPPRMTEGRAAVLGLIQRYLKPGYAYTVSLLEIQKLVYFLTLTGELNKVVFCKERYGPYADVMRHVLERMEGHFITGYGDGGNEPNLQIKILPEAANKAEKYLQLHPEINKHFNEVVELIEGFETPYGMELLATVHWVATRENKKAKEDPEIALQEIKKWSTRKSETMQLPQVKAAWKKLKRNGWLEKIALND